MIILRLFFFEKVEIINSPLPLPDKIKMMLLELLMLLAIMLELINFYLKAYLEQVKLRQLNKLLEF